MEDFIKQKISEGASKIVENAVDNLARRLPDDAAKKDFLARMKNIAAEGVDATINGQDYQKHLERGAYETSVFLANHYADAALKKVCNELPRGKTYDAISVALQEISHRGIESLCSGNSLDAVKAELSAIAQSHFQNFVHEQAKIFSKDLGNNVYKNFKFSGRGSRAKNKNLREGTNLLEDELAFQITDNVMDFLDGKKNFGDAAKDIVVNTGANAVKTYTKRQGAELATEAFKTLSKLAEKEIKNQLIKNTATSALNALANSNTLMQVADAVYDVGKSLKRWLDGEISGTEFLREVGQKGTGVIVSGVFAILGTAVAGTIGTAIGSAVGYFATNLLFGSVMQAFEEAELSRKRYEAIHAFCEESIREMEIQRLEFERNVAQFLSNRQQVIDRSLKDFEASMQMNDMTGVSAALNEIAMEFGGELQFKNRAEFDEFMLDKDSDFVL